MVRVPDAHKVVRMPDAHKVVRVPDTHMVYLALLTVLMPPHR